MSFSLSANVLQLTEGGGFEALHYQPSTNFDRSTKIDLTTKPPLWGRVLLVAVFLVVRILVFQFYFHHYVGLLVIS
ncbi:MAG: hypothetical protein HC912_04330 [Saprospiraceae bacterium]|nr:hypothetical protein [Saprospiraceae bacterium]